MKARSALLGAELCLVWAVGALAVEAAVAAPLSLVRARIAIHNQSTAILTCRAVAARWFAFELGDLAPGQSIGLDVSVSTADSSVMVLNQHGLEVPLETIYCGRRDKVWETRSPLDISRVGAAGRASPRIEVVCKDQDGALTCRLS